MSQQVAGRGSRDWEWGGGRGGRGVGWGVPKGGGQVRTQARERAASATPGARKAPRRGRDFR